MGMHTIQGHGWIQFCCFHSILGQPKNSYRWVRDRDRIHATIAKVAIFASRQPQPKTTLLGWFTSKNTSVPNPKEWNDDEGLSNFVQDCHKVDLHEDLYITHPPATYTRGQRKIDYILGTEKISAAVIKGGMTSFDDGLKFSDHRALFIDLNESALFHDKSKDPTARKNRGLSS